MYCHSVWDGPGSNDNEGVWCGTESNGNEGVAYNHQRSKTGVWNSHGFRVIQDTRWGKILTLYRCTFGVLCIQPTGLILQWKLISFGINVYWSYTHTTTTTKYHKSQFIKTEAQTFLFEFYDLNKDVCTVSWLTFCYQPCT